MLLINSFFLLVLFLIYIFGFEQNVPSYCESFIEEAVLEEFVESDGDEADIKLSFRAEEPFSGDFCCCWSFSCPTIPPLAGRGWAWGWIGFLGPFARVQSWCGPSAPPRIRVWGWRLHWCTPELRLRRSMSHRRGFSLPQRLHASRSGPQHIHSPGESKILFSRHWELANEWIEGLNVDRHLQTSFW